MEEPLEELLILLMLHMDDLREPRELGELGGEGCCRKMVHSEEQLLIMLPLQTGDGVI